MSTASEPVGNSPCPGEFDGSSHRMEFFRKQRWLPFVLPLAVYLVSGTLEPEYRAPQHQAEEQQLDQAEPEMVHDEAQFGKTSGSVAPSYPWIYTLRIILTLASVVFVWPYYRTVPCAISWWALPAGLLGGFAWIGICRMGVTATILSTLGLTELLELGARASFNPLESLSESSALLVLFLAVRFFGLVLLVPLIEEFFLRGFLMRFFVRSDWWTLPLGAVTWLSAGIGTLYGVLSHPAEAIAAAVWFSLVTLLYARTRNIWDCVLAHAITNLMLGIYVLTARDWSLW